VPEKSLSQNFVRSTQPLVGQPGPITRELETLSPDSNSEKAARELNGYCLDYSSPGRGGFLIIMM
jgi:hypothetical protein